MAGRRVPRWRRGFLRALGETGNVRLSAARAGVDHTSAYDARKKDAAFAARWAAALGRFSGRTVTQAGAAAAQPEAELVVRHSKRAGTQVVRAAEGRWSMRTERVFLEALAATANVSAAARAAGVSAQAVYRRRKTDAELAQRWGAALAAAGERVSTFLVAAAVATFDPEAAAEGVPAASIAEAIAIVRLKGLGIAGAQGGAAAPMIDFEAAREEILDKIDAIEAADARRAAREARVAAARGAEAA